MKVAAITLAFIASVILFGLTINTGLERWEKLECYEWQENAKEYPGFYLTQNESDQCEYLDIEVNAPVKYVR